MRHDAWLREEVKSYHAKRFIVGRHDNHFCCIVIARKFFLCFLSDKTDTTQV